jgi:hypothetical protein
LPLKSKTITIVDEHNKPYAIYTGQVDTNDEPSGYGEMVYYTDSTKTTIEKTYKGTFKQGERDGRGITTYYNDPEGKQTYDGTYNDGIQFQGVITYTNGKTEKISPQIQPLTPAQVAVPTTLGNPQNLKKRERDDTIGPIQGSTTAVLTGELRNYKRAVRRLNGGGGSPTISIPTPSKTHKSHQGKRTNSSNKSTFKRRKYTEE